MYAGRSAPGIACSVHVSSHARCHEIMLTNETLESTAGPVLKPDLPNPWKLLRYDTIRDAILTCARKPTWVSLIYRTEPTTEKCNNRKKTKSRKQICSEITVNSPGNPRSKYLSRRQEGLQWEGFAEKKVLSLERKSEWVMEYQITVSTTVGR